MDQQRRAFLALGMCFMVLAIYQSYFAPAVPTEPVPVAADSSGNTPSSNDAFSEYDAPTFKPTSAAGSALTTTNQAPTAASAVVAPSAQPKLAPPTELHATLTTEKLGIDIARDTGIERLRFLDNVVGTDDDSQVEFLNGGTIQFWAGKQDTAGAYITTPRDIKSTFGAGTAVLTPESRHKFALTTKQSGRPLHVKIRKRYSDTASGMMSAYATDGLVFRTGNTIERVDLEDLEEGYQLDSGFDWIGIEDKYFILLLQVDGTATLKVRAQAAQDGDDTIVTLDLLYVDGTDFDGASASTLVGYAVPKDTRLLDDIDPQLTQIIDLGFFAFVARPMLAMLHLLHSAIGNWGIAIILLTLFVKSLLFPVQMKFTESMYRMQAMKPKMDMLKEKFGNDKMRLNQEIADLYKREGVNPLGGCLPMFLQLPIFIGLYNVLYTAFELRQANFFGWITDLSQPDLLFMLPVGAEGFPLRLMPLLLAVSSYVQTKLTPTSVDNEQQKIMMTWMPVIFTVMFYSLPSGLMVYWLTQNLVTILQNIVIRRRMVKKGLIPAS